MLERNGCKREEIIDAAPPRFSSLLKVFFGILVSYLAYIDCAAQLQGHVMEKTSCVPQQP